MRWRCLLIAAPEPYDGGLLELLEGHTGRSISSVEASELQIARTLEQFFGPWMKLLERYDSQGSHQLEISPEDFEA